MNGRSTHCDYPPPWGGRGVYPGLCLNMLKILRPRAAALMDLRRLPGLAHAPEADLAAALNQLEADGRIERSVAPIHWSLGCAYPERDVTVWSLADVEGGAR
jgi:hypothetical protein